MVNMKKAFSFLLVIQLFTSNMVRSQQDTAQRGQLLKVTATLKQFIDTIARIYNYRTVYTTTLSNKEYIMMTRLNDSIQGQLKFANYDKDFAYTIKDSTINIMDYYQYRVNNTTLKHVKPFIQVAYDPIRRTPTIYFQNILLGQLLDTIQNQYHIKLLHGGCKLPPLTISGFIPIELNEQRLAAIIYQAHRIMVIDENKQKKIKTLINHEVFEEDIEANNPLVVDKPTRKRYKTKYRKYYDTTRKYYALEFQHMRPSKLLDLLKYGGKSYIHMHNANRLDKITGILPLYPHPLVLVRLLCMRYNMRYYKAGPESYDGDPNFYNEHETRYCIIPRKK